jgi:hypothetical protein
MNGLCSVNVLLPLPLPLLLMRLAVTSCAERAYPRVKQ